MVIAWIENEFPNATGKYNKTSDISIYYNCIAWACGDDSNWWSHLIGYKWPNAPRTPLIESLIAIFTNIGYEICDNDSLESGFEKVVLYEKDGLWKHAARQLPNGHWTSKLGRDEDIEHFTPQDLAGSSYGDVHCIMKRANP